MELERILQTKFERRWDEPRTIGRRWDGYALAPNGALVCWRRLGDPGLPLAERPRCQLWWSLPGEVWRVTNSSQQRRLCQLVGMLGARVTRLDLAVDDWNRSLPLEEVGAAVKRGQCLGYLRWAIVESSAKKGLPRGYSVTLGSPSSDRRLVFYDKLAESGGLIPTKRVELRLRDERAQGVWERLEKAGFDCYSIAATVVGSVDFRARRDNDKHAGRRPRLSWWSDFLRRISVTPAKLPPVGIRKSLQRTLDWLARQVSGSLAIVSQVVGEKAVHQLVEFGRRLAKKKDAVRTKLLDWELNKSQVVSLFGELVKVDPVLPPISPPPARVVHNSSSSSQQVKLLTSRDFNGSEVDSDPDYIVFDGQLFKTLGGHHGIPPWIWESA